MKRRASEAIKQSAIPKISLSSGLPIKASELQQRRHAEAVKALERAINQREEAFIKLARLHTKIWKLARQVQRYERLI